MQSKLHHLFVFFFFLNFSTVQAQLTLTEHIVIDETNSGKPNKVKFADIDGDGDLDLISTNKNPLELVWFENLDGTGNYSEKHFVGAVGFNSSVYPGDIDNDGDIDLVTASNISSPVKIQAFINLDGLGTFSAPILIQDISSDPSRDVYLADIDGDNDLDVITAYGSGGIAWIENLGNNTFSSGLNQFSLGFYGVDKIVAADIDNDGDMDIIGSRETDNRIAWFENYDGQGSFGYNNPQYIHTGPGSSQNKADFCVIDVDGDTYKDLVISSSTQNKISWYKNLDGQGNFGNEIVINSTLLGISSFYCGDIDNDGDIDIAGIRRVYNDVFWIRNLDGLGNFSDTNEVHTQTLYPKQPLLADLNMDNSLDIVFISDASNQIVWMKNQNSTGNFVTPTNLYYSIDEPEYANAHDLDGDNDLDILVCSYDDGKISWFENLDGNWEFRSSKNHYFHC
ncbi:VCBS repeat-containing protein [Kordia algicida OT-1]|uniref:FG-GAP repeat domain-containing protein n=1 Tax=Kordia algicida TaxID=221066 RepID=UPI003D9AB8F6